MTIKEIIEHLQPLNMKGEEILREWVNNLLEEVYWNSNYYMDIEDAPKDIGGKVVVPNDRNWDKLKGTL